MTQRSEHVFVVRIWSEAAAPEVWRGTVLDVLAGDQRLFSALADIVDFIALRLRSALVETRREKHE